MLLAIVTKVTYHTFIMLGFVGRQISLPRNDIAISISTQIFFGKTCISCFSTLLPSLVSAMIPILGSTLITCKSAIIPYVVLFSSRIFTFTDFIPIPFKVVS